MAWLLGVRPVTVRVWAARGAIERVGTDERGRTLYDTSAVMAYAATREYAPQLQNA